jgi:hypothetical protein
VSGMGAVSRAAGAMTTTSSGSVAPQSITPQAGSYSRLEATGNTYNVAPGAIVLDLSRIHTIEEAMEAVRNFFGRNGQMAVAHQQG